jgi:HK97 family phage major capsid protein
MPQITKALREATGSAGGYLVPEEFSNRLLALIQAKAITMADLDVRRMNHLTHYIPKVTSGTTAYWVSETGTITASETAYDRITLTAKKIASLVEASTEVLEDSNIDMANHLVEQMATDIALKVDEEILNGTGGTFEGLRYTGSFNNAVWADGTVGTAGTGSSTISLTPISKAVTEVLKDNHQQPDVSYWNPRDVGYLMLLTDSSRRPIFNQETFGSPLLREGTIGIVYATRVKTSTQLPVNLSYGTGTGETANNSDAIVGRSNMFGVLGQRRGFVWKTDYKIAEDIYQYQTTARMAFSIKYANAYCVIRGIQQQ